MSSLFTILGEAILSFPFLFLLISFAINLIAFLFYGIDKRKAQNGAWRISEATLLLFSFIGGGLGSLLGMNIFHHKTRHLKFRILVPLFLILYTAFLAICLYFAFSMQ
jgi:uncharacterized membrane protein YsdA (DUF1294 family)